MILVLVWGQHVYAGEKSKLDELGVKVVAWQDDLKKDLLSDEKFNFPTTKQFSSWIEYQRAVEYFVAADRTQSYQNEIIESGSYSYSLGQDGQIMSDPIMISPYRYEICSNMRSYFDPKVKYFSPCAFHGNLDKDCLQKYAFALYLLQEKDAFSRAYLGDFQTNEEILRKGVSCQARIARRSLSFRGVLMLPKELTDISIAECGRKEVLRRMAPQSTREKPRNILKKLYGRQVGDRFGGRFAEKSELK